MQCPISPRVSPVFFFFLDFTGVSATSPRTTAASAKRKSSTSSLYERTRRSNTWCTVCAAPSRRTRICAALSVSRSTRCRPCSSPTTSLCSRRVNYNCSSSSSNIIISSSSKSQRHAAVAGKRLCREEGLLRVKNSCPRRRLDHHSPSSIDPPYNCFFWHKRNPFPRNNAPPTTTTPPPGLFKYYSYKTATPVPWVKAADSNDAFYTSPCKHVSSELMPPAPPPRPDFVHKSAEFEIRDKEDKRLKATQPFDSHHHRTIYSPFSRHHSFYS